MHNDQVVVLAARESKKGSGASGNDEGAGRSTAERREIFEIYLTVGIGTVMKDVTKISYSYEDAVLALDYRLILGQQPDDLYR